MTSQNQNLLDEIEEIKTKLLSVEIRLMGPEEATEEDKKLVKEALRDHNAKLTKRAFNQM